MESTAFTGQVSRKSSDKSLGFQSALKNVGGPSSCSRLFQTLQRKTWPLEEKKCVFGLGASAEGDLVQPVLFYKQNNPVRRVIFASETQDSCSLRFFLWTLKQKWKHFWKTSSLGYSGKLPVQTTRKPFLDCLLQTGCRHSWSIQRIGISANFGWSNIFLHLPKGHRPFPGCSRLSPGCF